MPAQEQQPMLTLAKQTFRDIDTIDVDNICGMWAGQYYSILKFNLISLVQPFLIIVISLYEM
jgi:hypothetical protein